MSNQIVPVVPKRNAATGSGYPTSLALGELAVNTTTGDIYLGADTGVAQIGVALAAGTYLTIGTGNGTDTQFEFTGGSGNAAGGYLVSVDGIDQPSGWTVAGTTLTFSEPPPVGAEVSIRAILKGIGGGSGSPDIGGRAWSAGATYTQGDLVATSQRETWICIQNSNTGNDPATSPTWWAPQPADAVSLQLKAVSTTAPNDGQFLMWSAANNQWEPTSLNGSVTFDTEGTHYWTAPAWVKSVTITANAGTGSDGTAGQNGNSGEQGTSAFGGSPPDYDPPFTGGSTGANGADGQDGVDGISGKNLSISGSGFSPITLIGGTGGTKGFGGYGGGGGGGAGGAYYCSGAAAGGNGSGPMGGSGGSAGASGSGGSSGGTGSAGGFDGQRWSGNGGNGGDGCGSNGASGAGGAGTAGTSGSAGETYDQLTTVVPFAVYEITIGAGAGTASCTITY